MAQLAGRLTVCGCCFLKVANDDDSSCRDYYEHEHSDCYLGLEPNEHAVPVMDESVDYGYRCAGCGDDYVGDGHYLQVLVD